MDETEQTKGLPAGSSFYERPSVSRTIIPVGKGVPLGIERVANASVSIGGAYGAWGKAYDNQRLNEWIGALLGAPLGEEERMNLSELGFQERYHLEGLSEEEHLLLEVEVGARILREAALANGWDPSEVQGVLIGMSGPVAEDYLPRIAQRAGIPQDALKVSIHKACDSSVGGLHLALNPELGIPGKINIAEELYGKKVLVGGIEGLSRFISHAHDKNALQLFGNGAGVIGVIPGVTMKFLTGKTYEAYDEEGVLAVRMYYPHSRQRLVEISQAGPSHFRVAGLMNEPKDGAPIAMAGPMGMVKLFVRSGVQVVSEVYQAYQRLMAALGQPERIVVAIVHHANYKINKLKEKHLANLGIKFPMPWLINDFGNVSAASNMIAFLRHLPKLKIGDHVLFDGFGAGTYYDVLVVAVGG